MGSCHSRLSASPPPRPPAGPQRPAHDPSAVPAPSTTAALNGSPASLRLAGVRPLFLRPFTRVTSQPSIKSLVFERYELHCTKCHSPPKHRPLFSPYGSRNPQNGIGETTGSPPLFLHHPARCAWGCWSWQCRARDCVALEASHGGTSAIVTHPSRYSAPDTDHQALLPRVLTGHPVSDCCGGVLR